MSTQCISPPGILIAEKTSEGYCLNLTDPQATASTALIDHSLVESGIENKISIDNKVIPNQDSNVNARRHQNNSNPNQRRIRNRS